VSYFVRMRPDGAKNGREKPKAIMRGWARVRNLNGGGRARRGRGRRSMLCVEVQRQGLKEEVQGE
jgi:hypothetical protein